MTQEVRTRGRRKNQNKGRKQQRTRAPLRQPGATHQMGVRQILHSAWFSKHTTCLGIYHNACLKHSNFLNRNTVCSIVAHMEHHGNSKGTRDPREKKTNTPQRVGTGFKTRQSQHSVKVHRSSGRSQQCSQCDAQRCLGSGHLAFLQATKTDTTAQGREPIAGMCVSFQVVPNSCHATRARCRTLTHSPEARLCRLDSVAGLQKRQLADFYCGHAYLCGGGRPFLGALSPESLPHRGWRGVSSPCSSFSSSGWVGLRCHVVATNGKHCFVDGEQTWHELLRQEPLKFFLMTSRGSRTSTSMQAKVRETAAHFTSKDRVHVAPSAPRAW